MEPNFFILQKMVSCLARTTPFCCFDFRDFATSGFFKQASPEHPLSDSTHSVGSSFSFKQSRKILISETEPLNQPFQCTMLALWMECATSYFKPALSRLGSHIALSKGKVSRQPKVVQSTVQEAFVFVQSQLIKRFSNRITS